MMAQFQPGDVVVCVALPEDADHTDQPVKRAMYRITGLLRGYDGTRHDALGLHLEGMNPTPYKGYHAACFRKIEAPKTEIAARIRACKPAKVSA